MVHVHLQSHIELQSYDVLSQTENSEHKLGQQRCSLTSPLPHLRAVVVEALHRWLAARWHAPCCCLACAAPLQGALLLPATMVSPPDIVHGPCGAAAGDTLHGRPLAVPGGVP